MDTVLWLCLPTPSPPASETLKWLTLLPICVQNHFGGNSVALGIVPSFHTSLDLGPWSYLFGGKDFLLQGQLSVLTLISVAILPLCYHSST